MSSQVNNYAYGNDGPGFCVESEFDQEDDTSPASLHSSDVVGLLSPRLLGLNLNNGMDCYIDGTTMPYRVLQLTPGQRSKLDTITKSYYHPDADLTEVLATRKTDSVSLWAIARVLGLKGCKKDSVNEITRFWLDDSSINFFFKHVLPYFEDMVRTMWY